MVTYREEKTGVEALSRHFFVSDGSCALEPFHAHSQFGGRVMIAMMAPERAQQDSNATTAKQKDRARAWILGALMLRGGTAEVDTLRELRDHLGCDEMSLNLFKKSIWHLRAGDRDIEGKRRIAVNEPEKLERFRSLSGHRISVRVL